VDPVRLVLGPWRDLVGPSWPHRGRFWPIWPSW
jgi:hypothetical protein